METQNYPLSFRKLRALSRFVRIELAIDPFAWLVLQRSYCAHLLSFRVPGGI